MALGMIDDRISVIDAAQAFGCMIPGNSAGFAVPEGCKRYMGIVKAWDKAITGIYGRVDFSPNLSC